MKKLILSGFLVATIALNAQTTVTLTKNQTDAIRQANTPSSSNKFSTANDLALKQNSLSGSTTQILTAGGTPLVVGTNLSITSGTLNASGGGGGGTTYTFTPPLVETGTVVSISNIPNSAMANSSVTINGYSVALGGSISINKQTYTTTTTATLTVNSDTYDFAIVTAQATDIYIAAPTGTPIDGQSILFRIKDGVGGTNLTFDPVFRVSGDDNAPNETLDHKTAYYGAKWNALDSVWDLLSIKENF